MKATLIKYKVTLSYYLDQWHVLSSWRYIWSLRNLQLRKPLEPIAKRHYILKKYNKVVYELNCKCIFYFFRMCLDWRKSCCFCRSFMSNLKVVLKHWDTYKNLKILFSWYTPVQNETLLLIFSLKSRASILSWNILSQMLTKCVHSWKNNK